MSLDISTERRSSSLCGSSVVFHAADVDVQNFLTEVRDGRCQKVADRTYYRYICGGLPTVNDIYLLDLLSKQHI